MRKPKMILFDYGQTLINEREFDGLAGCGAVLQYATRNKHGRTAEDIQAAAHAIITEMGPLDLKQQHLFPIEVPSHMFSAFLYQSMGIELSLPPREIDRIFWDNASPGVPTEGVEDFLAFLKGQGIRTGVISNNSFCGEVVAERINNMLPQNEFEFILVTSEYLFRKPHKRIFRLALEKADLRPEDAWYIGDNYQCDVVGARNAGLLPVWYLGAARDPRGEDDVWTVSHWDQLAQAITELGE